MKKTYGHFDDKNREYVITAPATPFPWINYLGNEDFFSLISNTAGGYSFYKDAKFRRITRYRYNDVPMDNGGRYFYIKDGDVVWSPGWKPCKTPLDSYECRHGLNYTRITGSKNGIEVSELFFVPLNTWAEVQKVTIRNTTDTKKTVKLFSFAEWCLWNAATDMENFQRNLSTGEVEIEQGESSTVIYHKTEYKERRNHYAYYALANARADGFDTDRESFVGLYNELANPQCVMAGKPSGSVAHGWSPIASHYIEVSLMPGEQRDLIFLLGYVENAQEEKYADPHADPTLITSLGALDRTIVNKEKAHATIERFSTVEAVDKAFDELHAMWNGLLDKFQVSTGDDRLDRMVNIWNQYQCMITFNFSRSASFFESGIGRGMGFRDSNQDLVGFVRPSPSVATTTSAADSMMTPCGLSSARWHTSRRRATSAFSMRKYPGTTSPGRKCRSWSISAFRSTMWWRISGLISCLLSVVQTGTTVSTSTAFLGIRTSRSKPQRTFQRAQRPSR